VGNFTLMGVLELHHPRGMIIEGRIYRTLGDTHSITNASLTLFRVAKKPLI